MSRLIAYVDGSYDKESGVYGSGCVLIKEDGSIFLELSNYGKDRDGVWNVAGEVSAATQAIQYAQSNDYNEVHICYDYQGIEAWANGSWKAKKNVSKTYAAFVQSARSQGLTITFEKVKAHSGVEYNELADKLAKKGIEQYKAINQFVGLHYEASEKIITERKNDDVPNGFVFGKAGIGKGFYVLSSEEEKFLDDYVSPIIREQAKEAYINLLKSKERI